MRVAALVGTLLAAINYGDRLVAGTMGSGDWIRLLTYVVPFAVSLYSADKALRHQNPLIALTF
ncbi:hypothetical protein FKG94_16070 [Exilibacterium tricleocarpae]|uniref:Uncharacterized protein n=1 Tax=Exilibacterium tricleocarpae TaxID=2591008 RepID=A0A545TBD7_9GAMM|nr:nitrate/nitrite transporter NrtS [Exilibacterium tricleocarpae]TQV74530.1 hypothetical protein FKG94_16070 [Exilibacterium tricleocarpae]